MLRRKVSPGITKKVRRVDLPPRPVRTTTPPISTGADELRFSQKLLHRVTCRNIKQQLSFGVPIVLLITLLNHLNRYAFFDKVARNLSIPNNELPFQVPTKYTVRNYYNLQDSMLEKYTEFHSERLIWDPNIQQHTLKPDTPYLTYEWCPPEEETLLDEVNSFEFWKLLGMDDDTKESVSTCQDPAELVKNLDGLMTALYVAMMTDRVLIIQDFNHDMDATLRKTLLPNKLNWNVTIPEEDVEEDMLEILNVQDMEDLCNVMDEENPKGVEVVAKEWLGEQEDWSSPCLRKQWRRMWKDVQETQEPNRYRWAFWTLFQVHPFVLNQADQQRVAAGLPTSATHQGVTTFQPYYYVAKEGHVTTEPPLSKTILGAANSMAAGGIAASKLAAKKPQEDSAELQCAQKLFEATQNMEVSNRVPLQQDLKRGVFIEGSPKAKVFETTPNANNKNLLRLPNLKKGNKQNWYSQFWTDLVIAMESECLLFPEGHHDSANEISTGLLAERISITNEDTEKRCHVECKGKSTFIPNDHLMANLPWGDELEDW